MSSNSVTKLLTELKVVDLRNELDARGLDKSGAKQVLVDRLSEVLILNGDDPTSFQFTVKEVIKTTARKSLPASQVAASLSQVSADSKADDEDKEEEDEPMDATEANVVDEISADATPASTTVINTVVTTTTTTTTAAVQSAVTATTPTAAVDINTQQQPQPQPTATTTTTPAPGTFVDPDPVAPLITPTTMASSGPNSVAALEPPAPDEVPPRCPFTADDTVAMHQASHDRKGGGDSESMIVETQSTVGGSSSGTMSRISSVANTADLVGMIPEEETTTTTITAVAQDGVDDPVVPGQTVVDEQMDQDQDKPEEELLVPHDVAEEEEQRVKDLLSGGDSDVPTETVAAVGETAKPDAEKPVVVEKKAEEPGKNLWVTGLAMATRAADLKTLFSKYGRVIAAKIITSSKTPGNKCFGFVTMSNPDEASKCIQHLHRAELKGKMIGVERCTPGLNFSDANQPNKIEDFRVMTNAKIKLMTKTKGDALPLCVPSKPAVIAVPTDKSKDKSEVDDDVVAITPPPGEGRRSEKSSSRPRSTKGASSSDKRRREGSDRPSSSRRPMTTGPKRSRIEPAFDARRAIGGRGGYVGRGSFRGGRGAPAGGLGRRPVPSSTSAYAARRVVQARLGARGGVRPLIPAVGSRRPPVAGRIPRGRGGGGGRNIYDVAASRQGQGGYNNSGYQGHQAVNSGRHYEEQMRQREEEHRRREEKLRLEREKERLKYERERLEREKLELQQMRMEQQQAMYMSGLSGGASGGSFASGGAGGGSAGDYTQRSSSHRSRASHSSSRGSRGDSKRGYSDDRSRGQHRSSSHRSSSRHHHENSYGGGVQPEPQQYSSSHRSGSQSRRSSSRSDARYQSASQSHRSSDHHQHRGGRGGGSSRGSRYQGQAGAGGGGGGRRSYDEERKKAEAKWHKLALAHLKDLERQMKPIFAPDQRLVERHKVKKSAPRSDYRSGGGRGAGGGHSMGSLPRAQPTTASDRARQGGQPSGGAAGGYNAHRSRSPIQSHRRSTGSTLGGLSTTLDEYYTSGSGGLSSQPISQSMYASAQQLASSLQSSFGSHATGAGGAMGGTAGTSLGRSQLYQLAASSNPSSMLAQPAGYVSGSSSSRGTLDTRPFGSSTTYIQGGATQPTYQSRYR